MKSLIKIMITHKITHKVKSHNLGNHHIKYQQITKTFLITTTVINLIQIMITNKINKDIPYQALTINFKTNNKNNMMMKNKP